MIRLLHFSDIHVQLPDWRTRSLRSLGPLRAIATLELWKGRGRLFDGAQAATQAILRDAEALRADHVLLTGDLTQLAHREEFALARETLAPLCADGDRFIAFAGNHDRYPERGRAQRLFEEHFPEQARRDLAAPLRVRLLGSEAAVVVVESAQGVSWPVVSGGRVGREQREALAAVLALPALAGRCKLVAVHHAPTRRGTPRDRPLRDLEGASALLRACAESGVEAILCGHVHDRFDDPPRPGRPRVICAGSATSLGHEGYWDVRIERGRIVQAVARRPGGAEDDVTSPSWSRPRPPHSSRKATAGSSREARAAG